MQSLSFAVDVLCGLTQATELRLPSVTYDDKAVNSALTKWDDWAAKYKSATDASF